jgi:imidazolonepropionase-like amidohydrolase
MLRSNTIAIVVTALAAMVVSQTATPQPQKIAIVGATLIDVSGYGRSTNDIVNAMGAKFLTGSNAATYGIMPGSGLHLELTLLHRIGLSPREVLAAATSNYADVYGWHDVGRIEPGRVADLLLLDADPRTDVSAVDHIHTLVFKGAVVDRDALLTMSKTN